MSGKEPEAPERRRGRLIWSAVLLAALLISAWQTRPDGRLYLYAPAGPGDFWLIRSPTGQIVLIDGGTDPTLAAAELGRRLPFYRRNLDAVVLSRAGSAQLPGQVAALERYQTRLALLAPQASDAATFAEWQRLLHERGTRVLQASIGTRLDLGGGAWLRVVALGDGEHGGLVLELCYGKARLLLAHSLSEADEAALVTRWQGPVQVLIYPWQREPSAALIAAARPSTILYSDGMHSEPPALLTYHERRRHAAELLHEALDGAIILQSDGRRVWINQ